MEKLDQFFEKINGSYFGIITFIISGISITTALMLYMIADPSYSMTSNFISDLGTGPNGSDIVFSIGMILSGVISMPFYIYIGWYLQKRDHNLKLLGKGMIAGLISSIGLVLVGVFPLDPNNKFSYNMHIIAAGILFFGGLTMLLIYGTSEYLNPEIPNILSILSVITAILYGAFITSTIIQYLTSTPFQAYTYIIEWIGILVKGMWIIAHVYFTLKNK